MRIHSDKKCKECYKFTEFGKRLDAVMFRQDISNQELARQMYVAVSTISGYRTGRRSPNVADLATLSKILGVSSDYLIGLTDQP